MPRRMSCSMTVDAVRDRSKTVTRRHVDTWSKHDQPEYSEEADHG